MNIYNGPLRITPDIQRRALDVQKYAFEHRETLRQLRNRISIHTKPPGEDPGHVLEIPVGFRVVYSIEQNEPGWCHHVAINVTQPQMDPAPGAVANILALFGIRATGKPSGKAHTASVFAEALNIWSEKLSQTSTAQNLLFTLDFAAMQRHLDEQTQVARKGACC